MHTIGLILLCFAVVFATIAAFFSERVTWVHMGWLAVLCLILSMVFGNVGPALGLR